MPRLRTLILALVSVSVAGCGSAGTPAGDAPQAPAKVAPGPGGLTRDRDRRPRRRRHARRRPRGHAAQGRSGISPVSGAQRNGVGAGAACTDVDILPDGGNLATVESATLCLLNGERADAGLPPLADDGQLAAAALEHSQDMVANQYFDHLALDGRDVVARIRATGYIPEDRRWTVGENLAWGTGVLATPKSIVAAWMASQGHRENILRAEYREIGFGVIAGNPRSTDGAGATYTTNFGAVGAAPSASRQVAVAHARRIAARRRARRAAARRRARRAHASRSMTRARHARTVRARISLGPTKRRVRR